MRDQPIGVFDSGVGGLTVVRELFRQLPREGVLYLGDTARVPYGPRGTATIERFALELAAFLLAREVKALVIACNTVSAVAAEAIRAASPVPVIDVVAPTVRAAVAASPAGRIGVIGTAGTIRSGIYAALGRRLRPELEVWGQECPLFVPIAEECLAEHPVARLMAREYLAAFRDTGLDTLILGCTHYPLLHGVIGEVIHELVGRPVALIDSAGPAVAELQRTLARLDLLATAPVRRRFYVTDPSYKFLRLANAILERDVSAEVRPARLEEMTAPHFTAAAGIG